MVKALRPDRRDFVGSTPTPGTKVCAGVRESGIAAISRGSCLSVRLRSPVPMVTCVSQVETTALLTRRTARFRRFESCRHRHSLVGQPGVAASLSRKRARVQIPSGLPSSEEWARGLCRRSRKSECTAKTRHREFESHLFLHVCGSEVGYGYGRVGL